MFQEMGMDYWLSRTHAVYANLYKKEGDLTKAKENLTKAIEILKECGAEDWVKKYEKELASLS
jgi:Tfp pilus assembly protein PilF